MCDPVACNMASQDLVVLLWALKTLTPVGLRPWVSMKTPWTFECIILHLLDIPITSASKLLKVDGKKMSHTYIRDLDPSEVLDSTGLKKNWNSKQK